MLKFFRLFFEVTIVVFDKDEKHASNTKHHLSTGKQAAHDIEQ